ncbi:hypothetical protein V6N13_058089 [Hibiscus sabdariffa]
MDFLTSSVLFLLFTSFLFQALNSFRNGRKSSESKLPPGPRRLPILGNLLDLGDKPHRSLAKLSRVHGPVLSLQLGSLYTVVVSSEAMAKEVLQNQDLVFCNRTVVDAARACQFSEFGLVFIPVSPLWRTLRKVCAIHLFSTQKLDANQNLRREKIHELIGKVRKSSLEGEVIDVGQAAFEATLNLLSNTILSMDLVDPNSSLAQEFRTTVSHISHEIGTPNLADYFPLLRKFDPQGIRRRMTVHLEMLLTLFGNMFDERSESRKSKNSTASNDVLDTLIDIIEGGIEELDKTQITYLLLVLFAAGTDTTKGIKSSESKLPPGPRRLPILGNLLDLGDKPHRSLAKLAQDLVFCNRTVVDAVRACQFSEFGLSFMPVSPLWRTLRKVCVIHLFSNLKLDANQYLRREKIHELISNVRKSSFEGEAINVGQVAFDATIKSLSNTIFSMDLVDPNSSHAQEFRTTVCGISHEAGIPNIADYFPFLRKFDPQGIWWRMTLHFEKLLTLFGNMFDERLESRKSKNSTASNDVLDTLIDITENDGISPDEIDMEEIFGLTLKKAIPLRAIPIAV